MESGTAWHLNDIRSNFAHNLTGYVTQESEHPFASGSFGDIYRGTLRMRGRTINIAMKTIRTYSADDGGDAKKKKRIRREIKTWLNLDHNNVLPLLGTTMNFGQFPAMVCPWLENGSLISYLERQYNNLTGVERLTLVSDVAAGLQYLHSRSVVHGDLSGANVLIDVDGRACISDFGLSTLLTQLGGSTFATTRQGPGTLRWTAPELLDLQEPADEEDPPHIVPSPQSDVYSFGRIMLQVCPTDARTVCSHAMIHLNDQQVLTGKVPYHYFTRDAQVVHAMSRGVNPKRPSTELVTNCQWTFIERCWTPVNARVGRN
ncbi:kinase-like protein [Paxillus ammoniavirescens]|nr:kinase-like protein [Paxillus ammoniavirescens]